MENHEKAVPYTFKDDHLKYLPLQSWCSCVNLTV